MGRIGVEGVLFNRLLQTELGEFERGYVGL
jgi:hypothetical protein